MKTRNRTLTAMGMVVLAAFFLVGCAQTNSAGNMQETMEKPMTEMTEPAMDKEMNTMKPETGVMEDRKMEGTMQEMDKSMETTMDEPMKGEMEKGPGEMK